MVYEKMNGKEENHIDLSVLIDKPGNDDKIVDTLTDILSDGSNYEKDISEPIVRLLNHDNVKIRCLASQIIAELCKCEKKRIIYSKIDIVAKLIEYFKDDITETSSELMVQSCRALGNICCDSYVGRDLLLNAEGIPIIVDLLPRSLRCDSIKKQSDNVRLFVCKVLLNLLLGGSDYIKPALDAGFITKIHQVLKYEASESGDDDRLQTAMLNLSVVAEYNRSLVMDRDLTLLIVDILKAVRSYDISEASLEYLHYQAEHDDVKLILAKAAVPQMLWSMLEKYRALAIDEEMQELKKLACDLIVLILTGDEAMDVLYGDGKGEFYLKIIDNLEFEDVELTITAILSVGNFARSDGHCTHMMDSGVFTKLMSILQSHKNHKDDVRIQHVVLSGLRNLVIPHRNKPIAIKQGILPLLVEMVPNVAQYHVVFKLLATLRMLVDGQETVAVDLASANILEQVAVWGTQIEHSGVSNEASRLIARIVRELKTQESLTKIVDTKDCVKCLVNMICSNHTIIQNEAIMSLTILCATHLFDASSPVNGDASVDRKMTFVELLIEANLPGQLVNAIEKNITSGPKEIIKNMLKFTTLIMKHGTIHERLCQNDIVAYLKKLKADNPNLDDRKPVDDLLTEFETKVDETKF